MSRFDFGDSLYKEANSSNRQRLSYAEIEVKKGLEAGPFQLLKNAKSETELEQRKALIQGRVDELVTIASNKYEVDAQALQAYASAKVAEVAVTKPKSVKPDSPIGGSSEDSKYADTDKTPDVDGKTTVDDEKAVVEEPKRHKLETVDLNKDKQKDASVKESEYDDEGDYFGDARHDIMLAINQVENVVAQLEDIDVSLAEHALDAVNMLRSIADNLR